MYTLNKENEQKLEKVVLLYNTLKDFLMDENADEDIRKLYEDLEENEENEEKQEEIINDFREMAEDCWSNMIADYTICYDYNDFEKFFDKIIDLEDNLYNDYFKSNYHFCKYDIINKVKNDFSESFGDLSLDILELIENKSEKNAEILYYLNQLLPNECDCDYMTEVLKNYLYKVYFNLLQNINNLE